MYSNGWIALYSYPIQEYLSAYDCLGDTALTIVLTRKEMLTDNLDLQVIMRRHHCHQKRKTIRPQRLPLIFWRKFLWHYIFRRACSFEKGLVSRSKISVFPSPEWGGWRLGNADPIYRCQEPDWPASIWRNTLWRQISTYLTSWDLWHNGVSARWQNYHFLNAGLHTSYYC